MSSVHPELSQEQAFVDRAYQLLDKGLGDAERSMADFQSQHRSTAVAIQRALRVLKESKGTGQLVFGEMRSSDGEDLYIGRRRVRDENYEPWSWAGTPPPPRRSTTPRRPNPATSR